MQLCHLDMFVFSSVTPLSQEYELGYTGNSLDPEASCEILFIIGLLCVLNDNFWITLVCFAQLIVFGILFNLVCG